MKAHMSNMEKSNASNMRHMFITVTPRWRLPISLNSAANVHEQATPRDINSPM